MNAGTIFIKAHLCLSVRQPWAWLLVNGYKDIENRVWSTDYRGALLIHASMGGTERERNQESLKAIALESRFSLDIPWPDEELPRGGIVGTADLTGIMRDSSSPWAMKGQRHWQIANAKPMPFISLPGKLNLFTVYEWEDPDGARVFGFDKPWDTAPRKEPVVSRQ